MKFQRLTILASAVILGLGLSSGAYAFSAEMTKSYSQGDKASFLAGAHNQKGISCQMCHTTDKVSDSETEINKQCVMCHEPNALVKKTEKPHQPNPHKSHLGDVQCTACQSGHTPSVAYCTNCHDFPSMKDMKFGKGAKPASQYEDLTKYDNAKPERTETTDILVVGSGAAGFVAAFTAQEAGVKNIIMVEKMAVPGGNSQLAAGGMNAAGTPYQKEKGIEDNAKLMFEDTMKGGKNVSNPELAKILAERSADSIKWLADRGAVLSHVGRGGGASAARMHGPAGGVFVGPYLSKFFRDHAKETNLDLRLNSKMVKLYTDDKGNVTGANLLGSHINASGNTVILGEGTVVNGNVTAVVGANAELARSSGGEFSSTYGDNRVVMNNATVSGTVCAVSSDSGSLPVDVQTAGNTLVLAGHNEAGSIEGFESLDLTLSEQNKDQSVLTLTGGESTISGSTIVIRGAEVLEQGKLIEAVDGANLSVTDATVELRGTFIKKVAQNVDFTVTEGEGNGFTNSASGAIASPMSRASIST